MSASQARPQSAPVALLLFNRPEVTQTVLERVLAAKPESVYVIADGPRSDHPGDATLCQEVRDLVTRAPWDCPVHTDFSDSNMGLKARVSSGLDWVFSHEQFAIVLEDDCVADESFFPFATELLEKYHDDERVGIVSGNNFLRGKQINDDSYFFSPDVRIWGWATWRRVWQDFSTEGLDHQWSETEGEVLLARLTSTARRNQLHRMMEKAHELNSWALPFVLHAQRRRYLSAIPRQNLVTNIGFGADSTHTQFESFTAEVPLGTLRFPLTHPDDVVESPEAGRIESAEEKKMWLWFPLRHPIDFLGRVVRYLSR